MRKSIAMKYTKILLATKKKFCLKKNWNNISDDCHSLFGYCILALRPTAIAEVLRMLLSCSVRRGAALASATAQKAVLQ